MRLGIDFGTTRTVIAFADRGNYPVARFYDDAGDAHDGFPSVVAERAGELRFGFDALAVAGDRSFSLMRSWKRLLVDAGPEREVQIGSTVTTLGELLTQFFVALREALLTRSNVFEGSKKKKLDVGELRSVVAVPANASGAQRFVTLDAFRRAGLGPVAMLNEPSAAGFEYTHRHRDTLTSRRDAVVVYDLGGGTFDASLLRMRGKRHEVLDTAGINRLGGDDFDGVLAGLVLERLGLGIGALDAAARGRLLEQCRDAKERLTPSSRKVAIDVEAAIEGATLTEVVLPVASFYDACLPLVERSISAMGDVMRRLDGDPEEVGEIAGIYVVGGGSELPIVPRALREKFGRRVHRSPHPSAAIAIGLAIACDDDASFALSDRYSRTFGVFRESGGGAAITFDPIFSRDTPLPARDAAPLRKRRDYHAAHNVGHFRFLECSSLGEDGRPDGDMLVSGDVFFPFDASLGETGLDLTKVAVERVGKRGPKIEEEYALDENGIVAVTIKNLDTGFARVYRLGSVGSGAVAS